jgi:signal transduction histidine kinase
MNQSDRVPFIRILNANEHHGQELWVIASIARLLNVIRVWIVEIENELDSIENKPEIPPETMDFFVGSAHHLSHILRQSYVVLRAQDLKTELAFLEEELFKFETLYVKNNICLVISEERVEFHPERYEFLKHSLFGVLHDLNQPANALASFVTMYKDGIMNNEQEFHKDMRELVVQTLAQLERGFELVKGSFAVEELSVGSIAKIAKDTFDTLLKSDSITYRIDQDISTGSVMYSSMWFRGLISNIVDNARKSFHIKGEKLGHGDFEHMIYLGLFQGQTSAAKPALFLKISDTGIGFSQDVLEHGFSEGESQWTDRDMVGQGVGMSAHVHYLKKLGGEVILHNLNEHGQTEGAELVIKLPLIHE